MILFTIQFILIIGIYRGTIISKFDDTIINALFTFFGTLLGAGIAGLFSVYLFNKNLEQESEIRTKDTIVSMVIYLTNYLKDSRDLYYNLKNVEAEWLKIVKEKQLPNKNSDEFEDFKPVLETFNREHEKLQLLIKGIQNKIEKQDYTYIKDINFIRLMNDIQSTLKELSNSLNEIKDLNNITEYIELFHVKDALSYTQRFLIECDRIEDYVIKNR